MNEITIYYHECDGVLHIRSKSGTYVPTYGAADIGRVKRHFDIGDADNVLRKKDVSERSWDNFMRKNY